MQILYSNIRFTSLLIMEDISYILYCDKQITFEDGTVWETPDFECWLSTYCGKKTDVKVLEKYYPYVEKIDFNDAK